MTDFEKQIEDIAIRLPKLPSKRIKNLYDILGVKNKETINSRVLAYFLDAIEEHKFGHLFFDALKELINEKQEDLDLEAFSGNYSVITEDSTSRSDEESEKQKRIDISIEGYDWCIFIENKINHTINNPLETYWTHAKAKFPDNVIGIILSISKVPKNECIVNDSIKYINITHKELINRVQQNLIIGTKTNDLSLFYLKEYIKTIESHYKTMTDKPRMNEIVNAIVKQGNNIKSINNKVEASASFIDNEIKEVFESFGFKKVKNWYRNSEKHPDLFFWIHDSKKILFENKLWFCFETRNHTNTTLDKTKLKELFKSFDYNNPKITHGNDGITKARTHIAKYSDHEFLNEGLDFRTAFTGVLETYFMAPEIGIVDKTVAFLNQPKSN